MQPPALCDGPGAYPGGKPAAAYSIGSEARTHEPLVAAAALPAHRAARRAGVVSPRGSDAERSSLGSGAGNRLAAETRERRATNHPIQVDKVADHLTAKIVERLDVRSHRTVDCGGTYHPVGEPRGLLRRTGLTRFPGWRPRQAGRSRSARTMVSSSAVS